MPITVVGLSALQVGTVSPIVANIGDPAADDVIVIPATTDATGGSNITSAGYGLIENIVQPGPNPDVVLAALWKKAVGGDADPSVAASAGAINVFALFSLLLRGVDPTNALDAVPTEGFPVANQTDWVPPSITTVTDGCLVMSIVATAQNGGAAIRAGFEGDGFADLATGAAYASDVGSNMGMGVAVATKAVAGVVAMPTWRYAGGVGGSTAWAGITVAWRPAPATGGKVKVDLGAGWVEKTIKDHDGTAWGPMTLKLDQGSGWVPS